MKKIRTPEQELKRQRILKINEGTLKHPTDKEFSDFFQINKDKFLSYMRAFKIPDQDLEDVFGEVMAKTIGNYNIKYNCTLTSFAFGINRQTITEYFRYKSRNGRSSIVDGLDLSFFEIETNDFETINLLSALEEAKKSFNEKENQVFQGLINEFSLSEIGKQLKLSSGRITQIVQQIRCKVGVQLV